MRRSYPFRQAHAKEISNIVKMLLRLGHAETFSVSGAQGTWRQRRVKRVGTLSGLVCQAQEVMSKY